MISIILDCVIIICAFLSVILFYYFSEKKADKRIRALVVQLDAINYGLASIENAIDDNSAAIDCLKYTIEEYKE